MKIAVAGTGHIGLCQATPTSQSDEGAALHVVPKSWTCRIGGGSPMNANLILEFLEYGKQNFMAARDKSEGTHRYGLRHHRHGSPTEIRQIPFHAVDRNAVDNPE